MRKYAFKIAAITLILVMAVALCTSCEILEAFLASDSGAQCSHSNVSEGSCIEYPTCLSCGESVGNKYKDHDYRQEVIAPTCTEDGYTKSVCKVCGKEEKGNTVSVIGHSFGEWEFTVQPTPEQAGEMKRVCSVCNKTEVEAVAPHTHSFESAPAKAASCTEDGWAAYEYCTECDYSGKVIIKALGHAWGEYVSNGNGSHTRTCENDPSHQIGEPCSGGDFSGGDLPVCEYCNTEYEFAARPGNSTYGYYALGSYFSGKNMQKLYKDFTVAAEDFFTSNENLTSDDNYYVIGEFDVNDYSLSLDEGKAVWKVFYISNPAYYWLDAAIVTRGDTILLTVADNYASASERRKCDAAIEKMTADCALLIEGDMSELEKVVQIVSFIVKGMEYAYESDGVTPVEDMWAHNITGLAVHSFGVCESYAKSFAYFCALNNIECAMGSGFGGGEAHAWNYVKIDGHWYGADVTWTDNSGNDVVFDKVGLSESAIFEEHMPHQSVTPSVDFIYAAPELADENIELTALYKNGEKVGYYKSIDDAFAAMTDADAEYEIDLAYYSSFVGALTHTVNVTKTPAVKKLTITGRNEFVGEGYYDNNTPLYLAADLTFGSDVEIRNLNIEPTEDAVIKLNGNTLTIGGESIYIDTRIVGTEKDSVLVAATVRGAYVFGGIDVYKLDVKSNSIILGADSHIVYGSYGNIYTQNGADVDIDNQI